MPVFDLVSAGEAFEDLIFSGLSRLPRAGEEVRTDRFARTVGGGAIITAVAAARSGLRCSVVSGLGPAAVELLVQERIDRVDLRRPHERPAVSAALSTSKNRSFVTFTGVNDRLESRLFAPLRAIAARHVHLAFGPSRCLRWVPVLHAFRRRGVTTSWDFGWNERLLRDPGFFRLIDSLDYLLLNEQEAALYARTPRLPSALRFWKGRGRPVVVKLGPRGCRCVSPDMDVLVPAPAVKVVDTTGAGDAFNGGFLAARLQGAALLPALRAGNRLGALSTRRAGGIDGLPRGRGLR
jgi:sugar/nucleoside kinase (ribokinase family)